MLLDQPQQIDGVEILHNRRMMTGQQAVAQRPEARGVVERQKGECSPASAALNGQVVEELAEIRMLGISLCCHSVMGREF